MSTYLYQKKHCLPKSNFWDIIFCITFFTRANMTSCYWNAIILTSSTLVWVGNNFFLRECHEDSNLDGFWKQMMCVLRQPSIDVYLGLHPWHHRGQWKDDECLFDHMVLGITCLSRSNGTYHMNRTYVWSMPINRSNSWSKGVGLCIHSIHPQRDHCKKSDKLLN